MEAAQMMLEQGTYGASGRCAFCHFDFDGKQPHAKDCPWLMMPQIIAALEAYEKVTG